VAVLPAHKGEADMTIIARMVSRMVLVRFLAVLIGITIFVLSLESVSYSKEILALQPGSPLIVLHYMLMRAPATLSTFLPMSFLIALLLTLTELSLRNEIVSVFAAGVSPVRLVFMLMPAVALVGGINWLLLDRAVPYAAPTLRNWAVADYGEKKIRISENDPLWLRNGNDVLRAEKASANSRNLEKVTIFHRDVNGLLLEQITADKAERTTAGWQLTGVTRYDRSGRAPEILGTSTFSGRLQPAAAGSRSGDPEEMSMSDIAFFIKNKGFGIRPTYVYQTWWHKRIAATVAAFILMALCIPLATSFRRGGGLGIVFAGGIGLGFLYFITDGIFLTTGEIGILPPWLASWMPNMAFGLLALLMLLRREKLSGT
jgi:lipopolysaccharide export system permease protein